MIDVDSIEQPYNQHEPDNKGKLVCEECKKDGLWNVLVIKIGDNTHTWCDFCAGKLAALLTFATK